MNEGAVDHLATKVAQMAQGRVESLRRMARKEIALRLLEANGSVSAEEVQAKLDAEFKAPEVAQLLHQLQAKAESGLAKAKVEADRRAVAVAKVAEKVLKYERLLAGVRADEEAVIGKAAAAQEAVVEARELVDFLKAAGGDASLAPAPVKLAVQAGTARLGVAE